MKMRVISLFCALVCTPNTLLKAGADLPTKTTAKPQRLLILINDFADFADAGDPSLLSLAGAIRLRIPVIASTSLVDRYRALRKQTSVQNERNAAVESSITPLQHRIDAYHDAVRNGAKIACQLQQAAEGGTLLAAARMYHEASNIPYNTNAPLMGAQTDEHSRLARLAQEAALASVTSKRMYYENQAVRSAALRDIHTIAPQLKEAWTQVAECELTGTWHTFRTGTDDLCVLWPQELSIDLTEVSSLVPATSSDSRSLNKEKSILQLLANKSNNAKPLLATIDALTQATKHRWLLVMEGHGTPSYTQGNAPDGIDQNAQSLFAGMSLKNFLQLIRGLHKRQDVAALVIATCYGGGQHVREIAQTLSGIEDENERPTPFAVAILATGDNPTTNLTDDIPLHAEASIAQTSQLAHTFELAESLERTPDDYPPLAHQITDTSIPLIRRATDKTFTPHPQLATVFHDAKRRTGASQRQTRALFLSTSEEIETPVTLRAQAPHQLPFFVPGTPNALHRLRTVRIESERARSDATGIAHQFNHAFNRLNTPAQTHFYIDQLHIQTEEASTLLKRVLLRTKQHGSLTNRQRVLNAIFTRDGHLQRLEIISDAKTAEPVSIEQENPTVPAYLGIEERGTRTRC